MRFRLLESSYRELAAHGRKIIKEFLQRVTALNVAECPPTDNVETTGARWRIASMRGACRAFGALPGYAAISTYSTLLTGAGMETPSSRMPSR